MRIAIVLLFAAATTSVAQAGEDCAFCGRETVRIEGAAPGTAHYLCRACSGVRHVLADGRTVLSTRVDGRRHTSDEFPLPGPDAAETVLVPLRGHPVTRSAHPVTLPGHPLELPGHPVTRPGHPVERPAHPVTRPSHPVERPSHPVERPSHPVERAAAPVTLPGHPVERSSHPVTRMGHPVTRSGHPLGLNLRRTGAGSDTMLKSTARRAPAREYNTTPVRRAPAYVHTTTPVRRAAPARPRR
jgi:hypothetical protein